MKRTLWTLFAAVLACLTLPVVLIWLALVGLDTDTPADLAGRDDWWADL